MGGDPKSTAQMGSKMQDERVISHQLRSHRSPWPQQCLAPGLLEPVLPLSSFSQLEKSLIVLLFCA